MADALDCVLDLMRRLPPQKVEDNTSKLTQILPELTDDILESIDQPLIIAKCTKTGKHYLQADFNRVGDSYRSPWSNEYEPSIQDADFPNTKLRQLEVTANQAFDTYRELYYEGGVSSVYFWEVQNGFAGAILIKKVNDSNKNVRGVWDSIHVFQCHEKGPQSHYELTSTVMLYTIKSTSTLGYMNLSGSITRQETFDLPATDPSQHISNLGKMVEEIEMKIRSMLQEVYFQKTKDVVNIIRSTKSKKDEEFKLDFKNSLANSLKQRAMKNNQE